MEPQESLSPEIHYWTSTSRKVRSGQIVFNHVGGHQYTYWMQITLCIFTNSEGTQYKRIPDSIIQPIYMYMYKTRDDDLK